MKELQMNAVLGSFVPNRLHLTLNDNEINATSLSEEEVELKRRLTFIHEKIHFYQTAMSGYGQDTWNLFRGAVSAVFTDWVRLTSKTPNERVLPISHLIEKGEEHLFKVLNIRGIGKDIFLLLEILNKCPKSITFTSDIDYPIYNDDFYVCPIININDEEYRVNGIDIIESHAKYLEAYYAEKFLGIKKEKIIERGKLPKEYYYIYDWFINTLGEEYYLDFPVICELALMIEYTPLIKSEYGWKEMSPAWRFIKLTNALKDKIVEPFRLESDIIERYQEYVDILLSYCGYKSMDYNMKRLINRYSVRCKGCNILGLENRMRELLLEKQKNNWFLANPFIHLRSYLRISSLYKPPIIQDKNGFNVMPYFGDKVSQDKTMADGIVLEIIGELHLQALASQILGYQSRYLEFPNDLQCGYSYFGIKNGCAFQCNSTCSGSLDLASGGFVGIKMDKDKFCGCSFEAFIEASGIKSIRNIKVKRFTKRMITYNDLIKTKT